MTQLFWLDDRQWQAIAPRLPMRHTGPARVDDRRVISGIIHVLQSGCRWRDCPRAYGPYTTVYNRFNRWSRRGLWQRLFATLAASGAVPDGVAIDSSYIKVHRSAHGGKGGPRARRSAPRAVARRPRSMG